VPPYLQILSRGEELMDMTCEVIGDKWEMNQTLDGMETFKVDKGLKTILDRFMVHRILKFSGER